jgi:anhydro-N-acetylmuramic acid kinase
MSGTSLDGIDVAITDIEESEGHLKIALAGAHSQQYPQTVREALLAVSDADTHTRDIALVHFRLGQLYAEAVAEACSSLGIEPASIDLIGCHGQTIFHQGSPVGFLDGNVAATLQIGEPGFLAERFSVPVVSDFRPRDIAAGGTGAPLVPFVDYILFRDENTGRVALNIGGIANLTAIPAGAGPGDTFAFDTGPGNMLLDSLVRESTGGERTFDEDAAMARKGRVNQGLLQELLGDEYYGQVPPKSTGREQYGIAVVRRLLATELPLEDLLATTAELTARTIADAVRQFVLPRVSIQEVIASGGGVRNPLIVERLDSLLGNIRLRTSDDFGVPSDDKEAMAFAVLAYQTWRRQPSNVPSATGANRAVILGKLTLG